MIIGTAVTYPPSTICVMTVSRISSTSGPSVMAINSPYDWKNVKFVGKNGAEG